MRSLRDLNNQRDHARAVAERATQMLQFITANPGQTRRAILDAIPGKRTNAGQALSLLLKRGVVVQIDAPIGGHAVYALRRDRNRIRWQAVVTPSPEQARTNDQEDQT